MSQKPYSSLVGRLACMAAISGGLLALPREAVASCETAAGLAALHAAYGDLIEGGGTPRENIGRHVVARDIAGNRFDRFTADLAEGGFFADIDRVLPALFGMRELSWGPRAEADLDGHRAKRDLLGDALRATGCFEQAATEPRTEPDAAPEASGPSRNGAGARAGAAMEPGRPGLLRSMGRLAETAGPGSYAMAALAIAVLGALILFVRKRLRRA